MLRDTAITLGRLLTDTPSHDLKNHTIEVIELINNTVVSFHQWADEKEVLGLFLIDTILGERMYFMLIDWREKDNFYLVLFPEDKSRPIAELHRIENIEKWGTNLIWEYSPRKWDSRNPERKDYFKQYYGTTNTIISLPKQSNELDEFISDVFILCNNRVKADELSDQKPEMREEFPEGRIYERMHKLHERNNSVVRLAKVKMIQEFGHLFCQICNFDFHKTYGALGKGFIEAHHTNPIRELNEKSTTKVDDIALVCSNCHSMLHRSRDLIKIDQLKSILQSSNIV